MPDTPDLRPATIEEVEGTLAFALRYEGRRRMHNADEMMARITAERLVEQLARSGFVLMKRPPAPAPNAAPFMPKPGGGG